MHQNIIFDPTPFGFKFPSKSPSFDVLIHTPIAKIGEIRASVQPYPIWDIEYELEWARGAENLPSSIYGYLLGFFLQMGGPFSDFLYDDPYDNQAVNASFGIGDGTLTQFQLIRPIGMGQDIVQNLNNAPILYGNNVVLSSGYVVSPTGIITFAVAPAAGVVLTWSGSFFYRVRFLDPAAKFSQFARQIWEMKSLQLRSVILGSVLA
ncbi:MAG: DUF2460 domain-containing protein [Acidobacteriaceae bacterium]